MTRRHFVKALAAGVLSVPLVKPRKKTWLEQELADIRRLRDFQHEVLFGFDGEQFVTVWEFWEKVDSLNRFTHRKGA